MKNLAIFLGGVAAGALAGVLFAPEKGSVTRECLCDRVKYILRKKGILTEEQIDAVVEAVAAVEAEAEAVEKEAEKEAHHKTKKH